MLRIIFEITYLLTIIYLCKLYHKLFVNVVRLRRETKKSIGFIDKRLERAIRAHANFCETVPFIILLSFILYFNNLLYFALPVAVILAIGRTIHSRAISDLNEKIEDRRIGMRLTIYSMILAVIGIFYYISQLIYFLFKKTSVTTFLPQYFYSIVGL